MTRKNKTLEEISTRNKIRLYWWSERHIQKKDHENYGDLLGKYLVQKITGKQVNWVRASRFYLKNLWKPVYVTIGSVLEHVGSHCIVWGSGIANRDAQIPKATFMAVRGPLSRKRLLDLGHHCPEVYGDPALLLPDYYNPPVNKEFELGIIPHISDHKLVEILFKKNDSISIIDFRTNDIEFTTSEILKCKRILSSSLHGIIVAHAYQIPAIQVKFSDNIYGDGVKYHDYMLSVGIEPYTAELIKSDRPIEEWLKKFELQQHKQPNPQIISTLKKGLMKNCPF
ncbi:polysaccharide pyruvyl transferase family protein [Nonlabens sp. Hel1_33_55]|uniref:polysaccharide pyruvyl transferase family protein n=1 Tax=Nonlabens sp. Hel1_33_55 TaxID=1336802 RepID=UPI001E4BC1EC|nr:polysaccharide pyruvyl transferase family protein [Nonlabens sp. Hel1_33_55]